MKKINAAVIGLGVGKYHLIALLKNPNIGYIKIFDINLKKIKFNFFKYKKIQVVEKLESIFEDKNINFVCICSFDNFHYEHINLCIKYKKNIFVEKPICLKKWQFENIKKNIEKKKILISTNFVLRSQPEFIKLKNNISKGVFGKIYYLEGDYIFGRLEKILKGWRSNIDYYSVNLGGGIHLIDLIMWLTNFNVKKIKTMQNKIVTFNSKFKFPDFVCSFLKFKNNVIAKITSNFGSMHKHSHFLKVYGTKCTYIYDGTYEKYYFDRNNKKKVIRKVKKNKSKSIILNSFINKILKIDNMIVSFGDIEKVMEIAFKIDKDL